MSLRRLKFSVSQCLSLHRIDPNVPAEDQCGPEHLQRDCSIQQYYQLHFPLLLLIFHHLYPLPITHVNPNCFC